jgi:ABC-type uncharacterized transport system permease subunit
MAALLIAVPLYVAASLLLILRLAGRVSPKIFSISRILAIAAVAAILHGQALWTHILTPDGINFSFFNAVSLLTWVSVATFLVSALSNPIENLGIPLLPLAAAAMLLELTFPAEHLLRPHKELLDAHILISLAAYAVLTLAAFQAILLAIQDRHLRAKHPGGFIRALPPLQSMERLLFQMIAAGFVLQSLSLISGFLFLEDMFAQHMVHKTFFSIVAWLVYAVLLWGRWRFGWRGRTAIRSTLAGFISLLLAYVGSKLVLELLLGY